MLLDAASLSDDCKNMRSLVVDCVQYQCIMDPSIQIIGEVPVPSSERTGMTATVTTNKGLMDRQIAERFFSLLQRNPGLVRLSVPGIDAMNDLPRDDILDTFRRMRTLKELDMGWMTMDV